MDVKSPSAQNIVLLSLALDKDNLLKEELKTATNIGNFLEISKKHGYEIDHTKLEYMNLFFEQEIESMSRLTRVMNIIGHEKFEPDAAKELARSIRLMQNWIDLTSHLLPKPEYSLPRRQIELPSRIGQHLDLPTKALLRNIGVVFLGDLNFNFDEDTLKKWLAYLLLFVAAISLTSGDFLTATLAGIAGICLLNNW
ncbi:MAG: hypothetical protein LW814_18560 [Anabaena sp. CoA2_C59]|jgi:hypothetical protein|nr:hypothetical protein [Anabaena sp. CoA2_C59]MDJ0505697.1 hypothetical protein [Nostocales cyanobacterium LE14-WE12]